MTDFLIRASRTALVHTALATLLALAALMAWASSAHAQQSPLTRQLAANEAKSGAAFGSNLSAPGSVLGGPGAAMAPKTDAASAGTEAKDAKSVAAMSPEPTEAEKNEALLYAHQPPTRVRIAIVNATGNPNGAAKVAVLLSEYRRIPLEDKMGLKIDVTNISTGYDRTQAPAVVFYRPGFLRAALLLAQAIPGDTMVSAMRPQALKRAGVDVEVVVGEALP